MSLPGGVTQVPARWSMVREVPSTNRSQLSMGEMGDTIPEEDEIREVRTLQKIAEKLLKRHKFSEALRYLTEALNMDDKNGALLCLQATALLGLGQYQEAREVSVLIISHNPHNAQGHYLHGITMKNLCNYHAALDSFLMALNLDPDESLQLTNQLAVICVAICNLNESHLMMLKDYETYKKLAEIGVLFFNNSEYKNAAKVLEAARNFKTNQKGITMRVMATLADTYCALKQIDQSISLSQECCRMAVANHDYLYQTKSLVNIASLYLEIRDTHQAIVYYEKLLDLQETMLSEFGSRTKFPDFWTTPMRCGLHLNLSIAYKAISNIEAAQTNAEIYVQLLEDDDVQSIQRAEAYHNLGVIQEVSSNFDGAIENYLKYYKHARRLGNRKSLAQAYGCLGSSYGQIHNWPVSIAYHEQHITMANKSQDKKMLLTANEMLGDTLMLKGDYDGARVRYETMLKECTRTDYRTQAMVKCKIADAFWKVDKREYALHYYKEAKDLAAEMNYEDIITLCEYSVAVIYTTSTQPNDHDIARKYFEKLIPQFEWKLDQYRDEGTFCTPEFINRLQNCYNGLLKVLAEVGNKDCLTYVEAVHRQSPRNIINSTIVKKAPHAMNMSNRVLAGCSIEELDRIVTEQNATVLYFKMLDNLFMMWMLEPGQGITNFYTGKSLRRSKEPLLDEIKRLVAEFREGHTERENIAMIECRAIPVPRQNVDIIRAKNDNKSSSKPSKQEVSSNSDKLVEKNSSSATSDKVPCIQNDTENSSDDREPKIYETEIGGFKDNKSSSKQSKQEISDTLAEKNCSSATNDKVPCIQKESENSSNDTVSKIYETEIGDFKEPLPSPKRKKVGQSLYKRLYHILLGAIDDNLSSLPDDSPLVIIPDGILNDVPFGRLEDWHCRQLESRFRITYLPNLALLRKSTNNELDRLAEIHDVDSQRCNILKGGFGGLRPSSGMTPLGSGVFYKSNERMKSNQVSNPALLKTTGFPVEQGLTAVESSTDDKCVRFNGKSFPLRDVTRNDRRLLEQKVAGPPKRVLHLAKTPVIAKHAKDSLNTLTTVTATKTDITSSNLIVPEFRQIAYLDRSVIIGCPNLPDRLQLPDGSPWEGVKNLRCDAEMFRISGYLDTPSIMGERATKERFMKEAPTATILHIVTYACLHRGYMIFTPNVPSPTPNLHSYLVTPHDIANLKLRAQLVVLNCGRGVTIKKGDERFLANLFIAAGAQCVLTTRWPLPDNAMSKFYYHFYMALQDGNYTSTAVKMATDEMKKDKRYNKSYYWSAFILLGKDVWINIRSIRHSQLDLDLNRHESNVQERCVDDLLNPRRPDEHLRTKEEHLTILQELLSYFLLHHENSPRPIGHLIDIVDSALKRLHSKNNHQRDIVPHAVTTHHISLKILRLLWFNFSVTGHATPQFPVIVYPHWNVNDLLVPVYDAMRSIAEMSRNRDVAHILYNLLPLTQSLIAHLVDVLCITKHAPEIKLKITDLSVRPLWQNDRIRSLLLAVGFQHIGPIINFKYSPKNKNVLTQLLQFLISMSCYKSPVLLHKLDVDLLGKPTPKHELSSTDIHRLPSLAPLLLHRNQLTMATPWMTTPEKPKEMEDKMALVNSKSEVDKDYSEYMFRTKSWHRMSLLKQANDTLDQYGRPRSSPPKVKVSHDAPANNNNIDTITAVAQSRDYAHFLLDRQLNTVTLQHHSDIQKLCLPYITSN